MEGAEEGGPVTSQRTGETSTRSGKTLPPGRRDPTGVRTADSSAALGFPRRLLLGRGALANL